MQSGRESISLEHLISLNDEIAALVRAGLALESGLMEVGRDVPGRLGQVMQRLGRRMESGESLSQALAEEGSRMPAIYLAVVNAGLRAARLPAALEGMARFARDFQELRRIIGLALLYPLLVLTLGYVLFLIFLHYTLPRLVQMSQDSGFEPYGALALLHRLGETTAYWGPIIPILLVVLGIAWDNSRHAIALESHWATRLLNWTPWTGQILRSSRAASFAQVLELLIEQGAPLPEAMQLAGESTGDTEMRTAASEISAAIERGESLRTSAQRFSVLPPVLRWLMVSGQEQGVLVAALKHAAETYRRRATNQANIVRVLLPVAFLLVIGAVVTLLYGLTLFVPMTTLLHELAVEF